ncbi:hypothetical protein [Phaffia rhodozyma]|uniref:Uncharacterized protein n=1 Tax=Phaffia rhodozyma TaxID=264483 RepID=A0A0F7SIM2_PHARH|nr:hypothetical protein [Phaffia rhodozyma]
MATSTTTRPAPSRAPLSPFDPGSPYSSRPVPGSVVTFQRGPLLTRLKINSCALLVLVLFRTTSFYFSWRAFLFRHTGMNRDWINFGETVLVALLIGNAVVAWNDLRKVIAQPSVGGSGFTRGSAGRGTPIKSLSKQTRPNPIAPSPLTVPLTATSSLPSLALSTSLSSRILQSTPTKQLAGSSASIASLQSKRYSLPLSQSAPPSSSPGDATAPIYPQQTSPSPSLKSILANSTNSPKQPLTRSTMLSQSTTSSSGHPEETGEIDGSPLKVWKMRHSLNKSMNGSEFY